MTLLPRLVLPLLVSVSAVTASSGLAAPPLPPDRDYVTVSPEGRLMRHGQRVRFWGAIGSLPPPRKTIHGDPYFLARETVRRLKVLGFNMVRDWAMQRETDPAAKKGDLSATDDHDFFLAECVRQGVSIWVPGLLDGGLRMNEVEAAARAVLDASTEADWTATVKGMASISRSDPNPETLRFTSLAVVWDPRLEAAALGHARRLTDHVNVYTGLRQADDPVFAVWELTNEQWWMSHMMSGGWQSLPAYFKRELLTQWTAYLTEKYQTEERLIQAWGFLFPGENLRRGTILLAPMANATKAVELNDTNPAALAVFQGIATPIGRDQCAPTRTNDVIEFLLHALIAHKKRAGAAVKAWGKSCRLSPMVFDTGIGQSIQAQAMQQEADAVAHASYMEGAETDRLPRSAERWPFYSGLDKFPQLAKDVPWLEHNRPIGKPFFVYETQFGSPSKYRAEWPLRIAAAGAIQDWDAACWHYFSFNTYDFEKSEPYSGLHLAFPGPGAYQYDYTSDEIEQATMRVAGAILRNGLAAPAPRPTLFTYGRPALLDPRSMDYAGDYGGPMGLMDMLATAYTNGSRLRIDPRQTEFVKTDGPVTRFNGVERANVVKASPNVTFDVHRSSLVFDSPGVASYTGFLDQLGEDHVTFANGVTLTALRHTDPPGTPYPSGPERFTSFTLASEDGQPLRTCRKAVIALVSSSFNTGLSITEKPDGGIASQWGEAPVLVTRVAGRIAAPALIGMRYRMIDFNEKVLKQGVIGSDGTLTLPDNLPVWLTELTR